MADLHHHDLAFAGYNLICPIHPVPIFQY